MTEGELLTLLVALTMPPATNSLNSIQMKPPNSHTKVIDWRS